MISEFTITIDRFRYDVEIEGKKSFLISAKGRALTPNKIIFPDKETENQHFNIINEMALSYQMMSKKEINRRY